MKLANAERKANIYVCNQQEKLVTLRLFANIFGLICHQSEIRVTFQDYFYF